jgi:hypothetical protein
MHSPNNMQKIVKFLLNFVMVLTQRCTTCENNIISLHQKCQHNVLSNMQGGMTSFCKNSKHSKNWTKKIIIGFEIQRLI